MSKFIVPDRSQVAQSDKWDLSSLYKNDDEWNSDLKKLPSLADNVLKFQKSLVSGDIDAKDFLAFTKANFDFERLAEKVGHYASLIISTDSSDTKNNERVNKFSFLMVDLNSKLSWIRPAILKLPEDKLRSWISADSEYGKDFLDYKVALEKLLYLKPHSLTDEQAKLLSTLGETFETPSKTFSLLTNVNMDFGTVKTDEGEKPLTQSSYSQFMQNHDRALREKVYKQFYGVFEQNKNTLGNLYASSVKQDSAFAKIYGFNSALEHSLYYDKVPITVYDNLISTVRKNFAPLHKFYSIMKKTLKLNELRHYDVYVPLVDEVKKVTPYEEGVQILREALSPLGNEYVTTLCDGLLNGWADRYENKGKRSGAFSWGGYDGEPFLFLNYKDDVIRDLFTLAHEGGHSMHSWYSVKSNPYASYNYTIFEAEVASTFNEELLFRYLIKNETNPKMKTYLLSIRVSDILATLYRQTMFAEYEKNIHAAYESGVPVTVEFLRSEYLKLLKDYFGPEMVFEDTSDLEGLRIPHFYNAFYVYKYSTGISASSALASRVLNGGKLELNDYFNFLKSGGSRYPIEALKVAGVDMSKPEPIQAACNYFAKLVDELELALSSH